MHEWGNETIFLPLPPITCSHNIISQVILVSHVLLKQVQCCQSSPTRRITLDAGEGVQVGGVGSYHYLPSGSQANYLKWCR